MGMRWSGGLEKNIQREKLKEKEKKEKLWGVLTMERGG